MPSRQLLKELLCLEREGIIEKVSGLHQLYWCPKEVDQHPGSLPNPEDLFTSLAGGQMFTKLDLKHACQQMELDQDSRMHVTINTHKGLYCYTRLLFGVASAPTIFQHTMDVILQGFPQVLYYLDDILVTGQTVKDHISNLEEMLSCLHQYGVRLKASKRDFIECT